MTVNNSLACQKSQSFIGPQLSVILIDMNLFWIWTAKTETCFKLYDIEARLPEFGTLCSLFH